jgi:hypothetical protein
MIGVGASLGERLDPRRCTYAGVLANADAGATPATWRAGDVGQDAAPPGRPR